MSARDLVAALLCLVASASAAAEAVNAERFHVVVDLPQRWTLTEAQEHETFGGWSTARFEDRQNKAHVTFVATAPQEEYTTVADWMIGEVIPKRLDSYSGAYGYRVVETTRGQETLGTGETAETLSYHLVINGHHRRVVFAHLTKDFGDAEYWYWMMVANRGSYESLATAVSTVAQGVRLSAAAPVEGSQGLSIKGIEVAPTVKTGAPYVITLRYAAEEPPDVHRLCFPAGDQPNCWDRFTVNTDRQTITTQSRIAVPGTYTLTAYVEYTVDGDVRESNEVSTTLTVE